MYTCGCKTGLLLILFFESFLFPCCPFVYFCAEEEDWRIAIERASIKKMGIQPFVVTTLGDVDKES